MRASILTACLSLVLAACANFDAVSGFAKETSRLTHTVKNEFDQLEVQCLRQAEIVIVTSHVTDEGPLKDCRSYRAAHGRLADVTIAVLDDYARALAALADGKRFDVSREVRAAGKQLGALANNEGELVVGKKEANALSRIVEVLMNGLATRDREEAVRRLAAQRDDLAVCAGVLRSYFVASDTSAGQRSPYANLTALGAAELDATQALLRGPALRMAEPIRSYELDRELEARRAFVTRRERGQVGRAMADAIDAWQLALDRFAVEALSRDPALLLVRLQELHDKIGVVQDALQVLDSHGGSQ